MFAISSCATFRYYSPRQTVYTFDSAYDFRANVDAYLPVHPFGTTGVGGSGAFAFTDWLALTTHGFYRYSGQSRDNNSGLNDSYAELSASSDAYGFGGGVMLFGKNNSRNGFEFQAAYGFQRVDYDLWWTYGSTKHGSEHLDRDVHSLLFQPAHWHYIDKTKFYVACGMNIVMKTPGTNSAATKLFGDSNSNFLLEPGLGVNTGFCTFGMNFSVSPFHPSRVDLWTDGYDAYYQVPVNFFLRLSLSSMGIHRLRQRADLRKSNDKQPMRFFDLFE